MQDIAQIERCYLKYTSPPEYSHWLILECCHLQATEKAVFTRNWVSKILDFSASKKKNSFFIYKVTWFMAFPYGSPWTEI